MSVHKKKTKKDSIVRPQPFTGFRKKKAFYFPVDTSNYLIGKVLKKKAIKEKDLGSGRLFLLEDKVVLYQSVGAPAAVLCLEGLIASGVKEVILFGFCGSLNPDYRINDAVVVSKALSEEGTSKHYLPRKKIFKPSIVLKNKLENNLCSVSLPFLEGTIVSTDAPFRETALWLEQKQKKGIDLVDMETSAVFSLAEFRDIRSAALMIVSDELFDGEWKKGFTDPGFDQKVDDYFLKFV